MSTYVSTAAQYAVLFGVAVGATYLYNPSLFKRAQQQPQTTTSEVTQGSNKKKSKKGKVSQDKDEIPYESSQSAELANKKSKKRKISAPIDNTVIATTIQGQKKELPRIEDVTSAENEDFAQQMAKARNGTNLQAQSKQNVPASSRLASTVTSSRTEEDKALGRPLSTAGDEISGELPDTRASSSKDVSDMLELPSPGPTSLRLTNISEHKKQKQTSKQQFEQVQSKKKRNEQARREEQRRINQESERAHEQKKQEHLRAARMAEGTSKQGKAANFTASAQTAWQQKSPVNSPNGQNGKAAPLLDTFESSEASNEAVRVRPASAIGGSSVNVNGASDLKSELGHNATSALAASARESGGLSDQASISEEEQMERIREQEQESAWESVQSKKAKKKVRNDSGSEASFSVSEAPSVKPVRPRLNGAKTNGASNPQESSNRYASIMTGKSAEWADDDWAA